MNNVKFLAAAPLVLTIEGKDSDDPRDPGGLTRFGIALKKHPELTRDQLLAFSRDDALCFYQKKYWDNHRCEEMPWKWALSVFDGEVNQGNVIKFAQKCLKVSIDGQVGPATLKAMHESGEFAFQEFLALRLLDYQWDRDFVTFGKGWFIRVIHIAQLAEHEPASTTVQQE